VNAWVLLVAAPLGCLLVEMTRRWPGRQRLVPQFRQVLLLLEAFRRARDDDARQATLIQCGTTSIRAGLALLAMVVALGLLACLAPWCWPWVAMQPEVYWSGLSASAIIWWKIRPF
jgi:hypothetical protein